MEDCCTVLRAVADFVLKCVWPSTTKVGMGSAKSKDGWVFVCARYSPPGNMMGQSAH